MSEESNDAGGIQLPEGTELPQEFQTENAKKFYSVSEDAEGNLTFDWQTTAVKVLNSYGEAQTRISERESEMRGRLEQEVRDTAWGELPENGLEGYVPAIPAIDTKDIPDGYELSAPEGPLTDAWRELCHENKLGTKVFQAGIDMMTRVHMAGLTPIAEVDKAIGEDAGGRLQALDERLTAQFGEEVADGLHGMYRTNAATFKALEAMMTAHLRGADGGGGGEGGDNSGLSLEELSNEVDRLMASPEYRNGDDAVNTKVQQLLRELHARKAA